MKQNAKLFWEAVDRHFEWLITFGEAMLRLSPPAGERLEATSTFNYNTAGAESNVAVAASRIRAYVTWSSRLPDSPLDV